MQYHMSASLDYTVMPLHKLHFHLVNFRKVHKDELQFRAKLAGLKFGNQ